MPRHRTTFEKKKCPDDYQERLRYPGCSLGEKPFQSMSRKPPGPGPSPTPKPIPVTPVTPYVPVNPYHPRPIIPGQPYDPPYIPKPIIPGVPTPSPPGPDPPGPDPTAPNTRTPIPLARIPINADKYNRFIQESEVSEDIKLKAQLASLSYDWRQYYDSGIQAHKQAGLYDDEVHMRSSEGVEMEDLNVDQRAQVQQASEKNAMRRINQDLSTTEGLSNLRVDTSLSSIQTGGLVLVDHSVVPPKVYYVFHGRNAGMQIGEPPNNSLQRFGGELYHHPVSRFPHDEARNVSIVDDLSVHRAATSLPFASGDTTEELYPSLRQQAQMLKSKYGVENIEGVWYSNGGVKGHFLAREEGIGGTMLDPMMGARQTRDFVSGFERPVEYIRTSGLSVMSPAQNVGESFGGPGRNVTVTTIPQRDGVAWSDFMENHGVNEGDAMQITNPRFQKVQTHAFSHATNAIRFGIDQGVNFASGMLAGKLTQLEDPNNDLSEQANLMLTAGQNAAIDTSIGVAGAALGITGVGVAEAAGTNLLAAPSLLAGYEVSNFVGHLMDNALKNVKDRKAAHAISGATSAVAGVGTTVAGSAATLRAAQFLKSSAQAARAASTTVESAEAGTELTSEGAAVTTDIGATAADIGATAAEGGAGILEGGADAAGIAELTPIPGARIVGGLIMVGTLIAAGIGALFGMNRPDDNWHGIKGATEIKGSQLDNMIKDYNVGGKTANANVYKELTTAKQDSRAVVMYTDPFGKPQVAIQMTPQNLAIAIHSYQKNPDDPVFRTDPTRLAIMGLNPSSNYQKENVKGLGYIPKLRDGDNAQIDSSIVAEALTRGIASVQTGNKNVSSPNQTDFYISKAYIDTHGNPFKSNSDISKVAAAGSVDNYNAFTAAVNKYTTAQNNKAVDLTDFNKTYITPQSVLTNEEISVINAVNPNYFKQFKSSVNTLYLQEKQNNDHYNSIVKKMNSSAVFSSDQFSADDKSFLQANMDPEKYELFLQNVNGRAQSNKDTIASNAKALNLDYNHLLQMNNDLAAGNITQDDFNKFINTSQAKRYYLTLDNYKDMQKKIQEKGQSMSSQLYSDALTTEAHNKGYLSAADYYSAMKGGTKQIQIGGEGHLINSHRTVEITPEYIQAGEKQEATEYTKNENLAKQAGIYSLDEILDPMKWTPDKSEIKFAHNKGLTLNAYNHYMKDFADNKAISAWSDSQPMAFNQTDNQDDIDHFEDDLILAGYNPHAYTFTKEDSGVWSFVRDTSVPLARDAEQANKMKYINEVLGEKAVDSVRTSTNVSETISSLMKHAIDMNTYKMSTADVNLQQFWEAYSRPGYNVEGFTGPMYLKETVNPDGSVTMTMPMTESGTDNDNVNVDVNVLSAKQEEEIAKAKSMGIRASRDQDTLKYYEETKDYIQSEIDSGVVQKNPTQSQITNAYNSVRSNSDNDNVKSNSDNDNVRKGK